MRWGTRKRQTNSQRDITLSSVITKFVISAKLYDRSSSCQALGLTKGYDDEVVIDKVGDEKGFRFWIHLCNACDVTTPPQLTMAAMQVHLCHPDAKRSYVKWLSDSITRRTWHGNIPKSEGVWLDQAPGILWWEISVTTNTDVLVYVGRIGGIGGFLVAVWGWFDVGR